MADSGSRSVTDIATTNRPARGLDALRFEERRAWVLVPDRLSDARQAIAIADAIGVPYEIKRAVPIGGSVGYEAPPRRGATDLLDAGLSSTFEPPWPSFMLTIGDWPTATALWLQESRSSRIRIVLVGRPKPGQFDRFHAIVTPNQYQIPDHPAVIRMTFPPSVCGEGIDRASQEILDAIAGLRRPLTAVFIGGASRPFRFDERVAREIADRLDGLCDHGGGDLYVVASWRAPASVTQTLRARLRSGTHLFVCHSDPREHNPYFALLAHADRFVVTGDSVSMLVDAAARRRPLAIVELPYRTDLQSTLAVLRARLMSTLLQTGGVVSQIPMLLHRIGLAGFSRDFRCVHQALFDRGLATRFGQEPFKQPQGELPDELPYVGAQIRRALGIGAHVNTYLTRQNANESRPPQSRYSSSAVNVVPGR